MTGSSSLRIDKRVARLLTQGLSEEAATLLLQEATKAAKAHRRAQAAHLYTSHASILVGLHRDSDALRSVKAALRLEPENPRRRLALAWHYVVTGSASASALRQTDLAIQGFALNHGYHPELPHALGLRGVLLIRLGRIGEAVGILEHATDALCSGLHLGEPDLWLVAECLSQRIATAQTRAYLRAARAWAATRKHKDLLLRLKALESQGPPNPALQRTRFARR